MEVRPATMHDIQSIIRIITQAKNYFQLNHINQWQDGYPNQITIVNDILHNESYVLVDEGKVIGTMFFSIYNDPTYGYIYDGQWLTNTPYGVIHRIVVDQNIKGKGAASNLVNFAVQKSLESGVDSIRIDTHEDNKSMQRFLTKNQFQRCGHIDLANGDQRVAFERILKG